MSNIGLEDLRREWPALQHVIDKKREERMKRAFATKPEDRDERERIYNEIRLLDELRKEFTSARDTRLIEEQALAHREGREPDFTGVRS